MKQVRALLCGLCWVALVLGAAHASANSAPPTTYYAQVDGNAVFILPEHYERGCEDNALLREDVASGDVVQLAPYCAECTLRFSFDDRTCFVDECVPAGTYRYGFLVPYECEPQAASTDYYTEVTVVGVPQDCTHSDGNAPPQVVAEGAPWGDDPTICGYGYGCLCSAAPGATRSVFGFHLFMLAVGFALHVRKRRRR